MQELLAPAGDYKSFLAAISNGANAIYLGFSSFSARAYAQNFDDLSLSKVIEYAHLRNVKIYVTMNTIIYENELNEAYNAIKKAYLLGVDGLIIQDLALLTYTIKNFPKMETHASTQMGIDDLNGIKLMEKLGVKRVVISREVSIEMINQFKQQSKMPLEVFIHGALCVSYSGGCLMSGLIGMRSGNRGRCVGPCRKQYKLLDSSFNIISDNYILSMKDLNSLENINKLKNIDSLKIEGRMKSPEYVASIVRSYRNLLDGKEQGKMELEKIFNRTFTKGYLFNEDKKNITNVKRPNNNGFYIGKITKVKGNYYEISLVNPLNQGDSLRVDDKPEVNLTLTKLYDSKLNLINKATTTCYVQLEEKVSLNSLVYKTKDCLYMEEIKKTYPKEFRRLPLSFHLEGKADSPLYLTVSYQNYCVSVSYPCLSKAINKPLSKETIFEQMNKLNDTPYYLETISYDLEYDFFLPIKELNQLRRSAIEQLNNQRLEKRNLPILINEDNSLFFNKNCPILAVFVSNEEQYQVAKEMGIKSIYYKNFIRRNNAQYQDYQDEEILVGGYGSFNYYKNKNIVADHILNATNADTVYNLYKLGAKRVTLSYEINKNQIKNLYTSYIAKYGGSPNLEIIIYGHQELMYTKYCPLKTNNLCGRCKNEKFILDDGLYQFPIMCYDNCHTSLLNGKILNLIDNLNELSNYANVFRLQFTIENKEETKTIITKFQKQLSCPIEKQFNSETDTRGNYNREIL